MTTSVTQTKSTIIEQATDEEGLWQNMTHTAVQLARPLAHRPHLFQPHVLSYHIRMCCRIPCEDLTGTRDHGTCL